MKLDFVCPEPNQLRTVILLEDAFSVQNCFSLTHMLLCPKLAVEGVIVYGNEEEQKINTLLTLLKKKEDCPIISGNMHSQDEENCLKTMGASNFLLQRVKTEDTRKLYICAFGKLTDVALAYLEYPDMAQNSIIVWSGTVNWPNGGFEMNLSQDRKAANVLFRSQVPMWVLPQNTYGNERISRDEFVVKVAGRGALGRFLWNEACEYLQETQDCSLVFPGEAVVGAMINIFDHAYDYIPAPRINRDMFFIHNECNRPVRVYHFLDNRMILEDLFCKLELLYND